MWPLPLFPERFNTSDINAAPIKPHSPPHSPWPPLIYCLSLCICLFQVPHVSGIIQQLTFCDLLISSIIMSSRFIHIVACVRIPPFWWLNITHLYGQTTLHLSSRLWKDTRVASTSGLLWIRLQGTRAHKYLFESLFSILCWVKW